MTQRSVEVLIGRLVSDEELRALFRRDPRAVLSEARQSGLELSALEAEAFETLDLPALERLARALDARLQRASLKPQRRRRHR
jgi:hypothetical protein